MHKFALLSIVLLENKLHFNTAGLRSISNIHSNESNCILNCGLLKEI
jgi:hypothetical protein